jgi:capsular exopolysaccharide synthesis family protein
MKMLESRSLIRTVSEELQRSTESLKMPEQDQMSALLQGLGFPPLRELPTRRTAVDMASSTVRIRNPSSTRIVEVVCDSTDPAVAAAFVNTLAATYIEQTLDRRLSSYEKVSEWLNKQVDEIRVRLQKSEDQLLAYSKEAGLVFTAQAEQKLQKLEGELFSAQTDLMDREMHYRMAKAHAPDSVPQIFNDSILRGYKADLAAKQKELAELSPVLKAEHYQIRRLQAQIGELESRVRTEQGNVITRIKGEFDAAKLRREIIEEAYENEVDFVSNQNDKLVYYNMLKREVETHRQLYDSMSQKVKEANIASTMRSANNVTVVDRADAPSSPYKPNSFANIVMGAGASFFMSAIVVFVWRSSDRRFRVPGEVASYLQVPELGVIPSVPRGLGGPVRRLADVGVRLAIGRGRARVRIEYKNNTDCEAVWPASPQLAESFRGVLASIWTSGDRSKVIAVTSPSAASGKTSVICNIGTALAEIDRRVLLIDADLRKPELHKIFRIPNEVGLKNLVAEESVISDDRLMSLVRTTSIHNLYVLPSGTGPTNIPKLLYSMELERLLNRLRLDFDMILIDTPPMLQFTDARVLSHRIDDVILVFRSGHTTREMGAAALQRLVEDGASVLGIVLNDWNAKKNDGYPSRYSSYPDRAVA